MMKNESIFIDGENNLYPSLQEWDAESDRNLIAEKSHRGIVRIIPTDSKTKEIAFKLGNPEFIRDVLNGVHPNKAGKK